MRYPVPIFDQFGFVVCSGFQFLRSSPETLRFLDLVLQKCNGYKCDDQVTYNNVLFFDLDIQWDNYDSPNHEGALRVSSNIRENDGLLVESATGRSRVTNHTIKIWDRDFAWRLSGDIPEKCPSMNNWVGMPNKLPESLLGKGKKIRAKIGVFDVWDEYCLNKTKRGQK